MPGEWILLAAAANGTAIQALGAWFVTAATLALALFGRGRLPLGIAEGLFVAGLSAALLLNFMAWGGSTEALFLQGASLVSLAVVWFIVAMWIERQTAAELREEATRRRTVRKALAIHAAAASGVVATGVLLVAHATEGSLARGMVLLLFLLLIVAGGPYGRLRGALSRYAMIALGVLLVRWAVPRAALEAREAALSPALFLVGLATLVLALGTILVDWRRRVARWQVEPQSLLVPPPRYRRLFGLLIAVSVLVGVGGALLTTAFWTPLGVVLSAHALFIIGHRWRSNAVGELGLALAAEAIIAGSLAWLPPSAASALLGWALAGAYLAWLAGFWEQQLDRGLPWTTAGRLIPAARNLSLAAAGGQLAVAAIWVFGAAGAPGCWSTWLAVLCMLVHWWWLTRDARARQAATPALAACVVVVAALVPLGHLAAMLGLVLRPGLLLAGAACALALRVGSGPAPGRLTWPWNAYVGGILPVAAAYDLTLGVQTGPVSLLLVVGGVLAALVLAWRRGLLTARGVL